MSMDWLLIIAAGVILFSLLLAWLAALIVYGGVNALRRIFPVPHNLVRAHIDYLIMACLLFGTYFSCLQLDIVLPGWLVAVLCFGVLYNPFGFVLQAVNPKAGKAETPLGRFVVCAGFIPVSLGFGGAMVLMLGALLAG